MIESGFELGEVTEQLSSQKAGLVIGQSIAENEVALMNTKVNITVSQQQPISYRAQTTVVIEAPEEGVEVVCILEESTGEREFYRADLPVGRQEIPLDISTFEAGTHAVRVYLNGVLAIEKEIQFVEEG